MKDGTFFFEYDKKLNDSFLQYSSTNKSLKNKSKFFYYGVVGIVKNNKQYA